MPTWPSFIWFLGGLLLILAVLWFVGVHFKMVTGG